MLGQPENIYTDSPGCEAGEISVLIITNPSPASGSIPLTVAFYGYASGGVPPYTYSWYFGDGETSAEQNPSHEYSTGTYTATLTVNDSESPPKSGTANVAITAADTTPPNAPTNLRKGTVTQNSIELLWDAASDNIGVTNYVIYRDGALLTTLGNVLTHTDNGLSSETPYTYKVSAKDAAGNEGPNSTSLTVTTSAPPAPAPSPAPTPLSLSGNFRLGSTSSTSYGNVPVIAAFQIVYYNAVSSFTYCLDFGDGETGEGGNDYGGNSYFTVLHTYNSPGTYDVTLHIGDGRSGAASCSAPGYTQTITVEADPTPPSIRWGPYSVPDLEPPFALIQWGTNKFARSKVYYGTTSAYGLTASRTAWEQTQNVWLVPVSGSTTYYYKAESCDPSGNCVTSPGYIFTTP